VEEFRGSLGMCFAPGKKCTSRGGNYCWNRDMNHDLETLRYKYFTDVLVSLMTSDEYIDCQMTSLHEKCKQYNIELIKFPIIDHDVPKRTQLLKFHDLISSILNKLSNNYNVVVHCQGGLGRTGLVVASLLLRVGFHPKDAILYCRAIRPRTISTQEQEKYIYDYYEYL
jgi:protein-tyrosine phosphatase